MKKIVPDPPPILCVGPGLTHHEAITHAEKYLHDAIAMMERLPAQPVAQHQARFSDAIHFMNISRAMLTLAQAKNMKTVPV